MKVDTRLKGYFANATLFHQTGEEVWLTLMDTISMTDTGVAGRAANRFVAKHTKEEFSLDSS